MTFRTQSLMPARWLALAMMTVSGGCAAFSSSCCPTPEPPPGFVTTGGRFCVAQSLPVPVSGLTLGQAVTVSLRPGFRPTIPVSTPSRMSASLGHQMSSRSLQETAIDWTGQAWDELITGGLQNGADDVASTLRQALVGEGRPLTDTQWNVLDPQIRACCERALSSGILPVEEPQGADTATEQDPEAASAHLESVRAQFREELLTTLIFGLLWSDRDEITDRDLAAVEQMTLLTQFASSQPQDSASSRQTRTVVRRLLQDAVHSGTLEANHQRTHFRTAAELLSLMQQEVGAQQDALAHAVPPARESFADHGAADQLMVTLTRQNGRLISAPLWLVTDYSVGDIMLSPSDHIEVTAWRHTSLGSPLQPAADGTVLALGPLLPPELATVGELSALPSAFEDYVLDRDGDVADAVIIRRVELTGQIHDYILPVPRPELFAAPAAASQLLNEARLHPGDQIHLEILDLTPLIQESRRMSQLASQAAMVQAARAQAASQQSWLQRHIQKKAELHQHVFARVNTDCELITGVTAEQLAGLTQDLHQQLTTTGTVVRDP